MTRSDVADSLTKWRDAVRDAERAPLGTYERTIAESYAERLHQDYLRAVLRMTGRQDQLEGAIEASAARLARSRALIEASRDLRHGAPPSRRWPAGEDSEDPSE